ncbi:MAG: hypothetical protein KGH50_00200 [Candidatus Micrarchaeota archaeon]|nr:hypothetical protein [Candidatus Micrarchaeota archaeon]
MADRNITFSAEADVIIDDIDNETRGKYDFSIRELFNGAKPTQQQLKSARSAVDDYFSDAKKALPGERDRFTKELERVDAEYRNMDDVIRNKAVTTRVPYIKPSFIDADESGQEEITIDGYSNAVDLLITRLVGMSTYIADTSGSYDKYTLGSWIFSGQKTYAITINPPASQLVMLERSESEIDAALDSLSARSPAK